MRLSGAVVGAVRVSLVELSHPIHFEMYSLRRGTIATEIRVKQIHKSRPFGVYDGMAQPVHFHQVSVTHRLNAVFMQRPDGHVSKVLDASLSSVIPICHYGDTINHRIVPPPEPHGVVAVEGEISESEQLVGVALVITNVVSARWSKLDLICQMPSVEEQFRKTRVRPLVLWNHNQPFVHLAA